MKKPTGLSLNDALKINKKTTSKPTIEKNKDYPTYTEEELYRLLKSEDSYQSKITSEILLRSPRGFFSKYEEDVKKIVERIQNKISEEGKGSVISNAQNDPTNDSLRKKASTEIRTNLTQFNSSPEGSSIINKYKKEGRPDKEIINSLVINELIGMGPLQPLWEATNITEIICNGPHDVEVEIKGKLHPVPGCDFRDPNHLLNLINKLYGSINKTITPNNPNELGRLHDKSRMNAVHPIIAPDGPNFNIRRHSESFITPQDLLKFNASSVEMMTFLGNMIYNGASCLIVGGTGSGKTTLLNALTGFIRPDKRCVSLEKNLEMKTHPNKRFAAPMETIQPKPGVKDSLRITMRDLVNMSMQMRPETLIIGEITDEAAYDLCQALNTGHDGMSTVHANSAEDAIERMMSLVSQSDLIKGEAVYKIIASALDFIVCTNRFELDGSRKIVSIHEVGNKIKKDSDGNRYLPVIPIWEYVQNPEETNKNSKVSGEWVRMNEVSEATKEKLYLSIKPELTWEELDKISEVVREEK